MEYDYDTQKIRACPECAEDAAKFLVLNLRKAIKAIRCHNELICYYNEDAWNDEDWKPALITK